MKWYTDGAGWNGKRSRWAVVNDEGYAKVFEKGERLTNNQAEYLAMETALEMAKDQEEICSESELVVYQLTGRYRVRNKGLKEAYTRCVSLLRKKPSVSLKVVPRERNLAGRLLEIK